MSRESKPSKKAPAMPPGWDATAISLWSAQRQIEAIQQTFTALNQQPAQAVPLTLQAAYYLFLIGDYANGALILEHQRRQHPQQAELRINLAVFYLRLQRWTEAAELFEETLRLSPESFEACDDLAAARFNLHQLAEARGAGSRSLALKDARIQARSNPLRQPPPGTPQDFAQQTGKRHVIAFSLWGRRPTYLRGALRNLLLAPDLYPGWCLRFYVDNSVPAEFLALIRELGGELVQHPENCPQREKLSWRFQVANDAHVGYFLVRDADSVFSVREVQAVQDWLTSPYWFHVMRDWWTHTDLMLAGMWGGVAGVLPDLAPLLSVYQPNTAETPNIDQWFLRDCVWPYVRQSCCQHDRCFKLGDSRAFPGPLPAGNTHIGQDEFVAAGAQQERLLRPWIDRYPCLKTS